MNMATGSGQPGDQLHPTAPDTDSVQESTVHSVAHRLDLLDYGRLGAALAVLAFHYLYAGIIGGKISSLSPGSLAGVAKYGYLGVEFFFIISGYVIFYSARHKSPGEFAAARALRLYPAFWVAVLFTASFAAVWGGSKMGVNPGQVLVNLTMVPTLFKVPYVDGVYWTLYFELTFYFGVLLLLLARQQKRLEAIFITWPVLMLVAGLVGRSDVIFLGGYYPFFAAGALFAISRDKPSLPALASLTACAFLCVSGAAERAALHPGTSPIVTMCIVAGQFAFFALLNTRRGQSMRLPAARLAGGLTYPIYLIHAHVGFMLLSQFASDDNKAWAYPAITLTMLGLAFLIHTFVERRLTRFWHEFFGRLIGRPIDAAHSWLRRPLLNRGG